MIDLQPFCSTDPARPYLHQPFSRGEWTYATDGAVAIRVPRLLDFADGNEVDPAKVFEAFFIPIEAPRPVPQIDVPDDAKIPCTRCDGRKTEHDCPACRCQCGRCGGNGYTWSASVSIGEAIFDLRYVRLLAGLPNARIPTRPPTADAMVCMFDGGGALLMPRRIGFNTHIIGPAA